MGRHVKRVPMDFDWPLNKVWQGYLWPSKFRETPCGWCHETGYSPQGYAIKRLWRYDSPFHPSDNGRPELEPFHPANVDTVTEKVKRSPDYYLGVSDRTFDGAVAHECRRMAALYNSAMQYHLNADDIAALQAVRGDYNLPSWFTEDITPDEYTDRAIRTNFLDGDVSDYALICAIAKRDGWDQTCEHCKGHGTIEAYPGQRAEGEAWEQTDPPTGDGWQMWEDTSEGSPVSPVFAKPNELVDWLVDTGATVFGYQQATREQWEQIVGGESVMIPLAPGVVSFT